jgi:UDP-N-acetyl-D-galactosamine dehydrogenase
VNTEKVPELSEVHIAVVGLGYVGLPLAVEFGKQFPTIGFDISARRIDEVAGGRDHTLEVLPEEFRDAIYLRYSSDPADLSNANVYIVTVPTPIDRNNKPDLTPLITATHTVANSIQKGDTVIYESTVFPGATEEVCVPILENESGLKYNIDFFAGYSPERINPGDKEHRLPNIVKVTSGSTPERAEFIDSLYRSIITAGTHMASSIKVAEAAKVIENTQRDLNIALVNELALIFEKLDIDSQEVLEAAGTKWNFLPFRPGLVGGHCIGVDPYYLTFKAEQLGYHPQIILAGRRINDQMGARIADQFIKLMSQRRINVADSRVLILGFAFKENCPDIRNTGVIGIIQTLRDYSISVDIYDPQVSIAEAKQVYGLDLLCNVPTNTYDGVILAVAHDEFVTMGIRGINQFTKSEHVVFDVKHALPKADVTARL